MSERGSVASAMALGALVTVVAVLPQFLAGAMAVQITDDLRFGAAGLGFAVAAFRMTQIVTSAHLGRLADRLGATRSMRLAAGVAMTASIGIATTATSLWSLVAWMAFASSANALGQPAANRLLMHRVPSGQLGFAFGLKQSATPTASMLAGFAVPAVATTVGWRWGYVAAAAVSGLAIVLIRQRRTATAAATAPRKPAPNEIARLAHRRLVVLLSAAFGCALAAVAVVNTFFVSAAVASGLAPGTAGTYLAIGSIAAVLTRLIAGRACDGFIARPFVLAAWMIATGSTGILLLATMRPAAMLPGIVLSMGAAWGFNGVFWYALVSAYPEAPGRVTGAINPGGFAGSTFGTLIFGLVVESIGYEIAWLLAAGAGFLGAATIGFAGSALLRARTQDP